MNITKKESVIKLCVPLIYEKKYLYNLISLNDAYSNDACFIYEAYGSLREDIIGNLRPSYAIRDISISGLKDYISILHSYNIRFDYIINSTISPMPMEPQIKASDILNFIRELIGIGVDSFTVTNPYIISLIKRNYPTVVVNASICNEISTIHQIKEFENLGVDCFILDRDINRKFHLLKKLRGSTQKDLKLLCNSPCLYQCINVQYHANYSSFLSNSQFNNDNSRNHPFCIYYCAHKQFANPIEHIKAQWIRPEDLHYYSEMGFCLFKLDGRDKSSDYMIEVVKSYLSNKYDGNFLYLLHGRYTKEVNNITTINTSNDVFAEWKIGIDNRKLDGFIDIIKNKGTDCNGECNECAICDAIAQNLVINKSWQKQICKDLQLKMDNRLLLNI